MGILDVPFNPSNFVPKPTGIADGQVPVWSVAQSKFIAGTGGSASGIMFVTLTSAGQAITIPTGNVAGLALTQDATGSRTVSWPTGIRWDGGTAPTLSATAGSTDVFTFIAVSGGWLGKKDGSHPAPADTTAPSAVTGLTAGTATATTVPLSWTAATDNVSIAGYEYSTNGTTYTAIGSTGTTYTVTGLTASTAYTLYIRAYDTAGNRGAAASVAKTTAAIGATWVSMASDTFTAADGTVINGRAMETGGLTYSTDVALTVQNNKADWGLKDNGGFTTPEVLTGSVIHRVTFDYDISGQKNGNTNNIYALVWHGGTRTGANPTRSTAHQVKIAKAAYNSSVATMTGTTPFGEALIITAQNGQNLSAVPLTGTFVVETLADGLTINVTINGVLWATVSRLAETMTVGQKAYAHMFAAWAKMDNLLIEAYK